MQKRKGKKRVKQPPTLRDRKPQKKSSNGFPATVAVRLFLGFLGFPVPEHRGWLPVLRLSQDSSICGRQEGFLFSELLHIAQDLGAGPLSALAPKSKFYRFRLRFTLNL
jgi:hypothetical protein